jgi:hypothetical protein
MERSAIRDAYIGLENSDRVRTEQTEASVSEENQSEKSDQLPPGNKKGRHPLFGALKDITFVPPGVDLTEPADPEWADLVDKKYGPEVR